MKKGGPGMDRLFFLQQAGTVMAPRAEILNASRTGSYGTAVTREEAFRLHCTAKQRLIFRQCLRDAMLYSTGLARKTTALYGRDYIILAGTLGHAERLVDDETERRTCEIHFLVTAIHDNLAGARLQPNAGDGVFTTAGGIGAALCIDFLFADDSCDLYGSFCTQCFEISE
jgi:hypothetical protein